MLDWPLPIEPKATGTLLITPVRDTAKAAGGCALTALDPMQAQQNQQVCLVTVVGFRSGPDCPAKGSCPQA